ncbi:MAG TPA: ABC transporter permease [Firmicutes bacterium]|nr:ABC transporter permease [Bacillota bacterium]
MQLSSRRVHNILDRIPLLRELLRHPLGAAGFFIVVILLITAILAPLIAPYYYADQNIANSNQGPSSSHILGTDHLGRDLLSRVIYGSRIALGTAIPSVAIALVLGTLLGLISGYMRGWVDDLIIVILNALYAFPSIVLALAILALLGPSLVNVVLVIGITWSPGYALVVRAQVLSAKENVYVEAERSLGATDARILGAHILPNVIAPTLLLAAMDLPWVITFEAGLSFLGLGVPPPNPSWGVMLSDGFDLIRQSPWPIVWSGLALIITTFGVTLFGETLRDILDPKLSGKRGI